MKRIHIVGQKRHGKTTLVVELVREFRRRGIRVGTIKHSRCLAEVRNDVTAVVTDDRPNVTVPVRIRSDVELLADRIWELATRAHTDLLLGEARGPGGSGCRVGCDETQEAEL